jgi:uncharacterized protein (TIGR03083 family)
MTPDDFVRHLRADAQRLRDVASGNLTASVPSCPEWDVAELVRHTAAVYQHKIACMRLGRRPEEAEWPHDPPDGDVVTWLTDSLGELVSELTARGPSAPSYTWYPPDQTVGFWFRRMAQETAVHRVDGELAAGSVTPIDPEIAVDGVDEILVTFVGGPWWADDPVDAASGRTVAVRAGGDSWHLTLDRTAVPVVRGGDLDADLTISGEPHDVLLWLWGGRVTDEVVSIVGDRALLPELRSRLDYTTS